MGAVLEQWPILVVVTQLTERWVFLVPGEFVILSRWSSDSRSEAFKGDGLEKMTSFHEVRVKGSQLVRWKECLSMYEAVLIAGMVFLFPNDLRRSNDRNLCPRSMVFIFRFLPLGLGNLKEKNCIKSMLFNVVTCIRWKVENMEEIRMLLHAQACQPDGLNQLQVNSLYYEHHYNKIFTTTNFCESHGRTSTGSTLFAPHYKKIAK